MSQKAPTGKPFIPKPSERINTFLNQLPTSAVAVGQVWDCTLVIIEPMPEAIIWVPRVAMKGGSLSFATNMPFAKPNTTPTNIVRNTESISGQPCLKEKPPSSAAHIIAVPRERSIPPVMMTKVTPNAIKPM